MISCSRIRTSIVFSLLAVTALLVLPAGDAFGWTNVDNCLSCHSDFRDGDPSSHSLHIGVVNDCRDCHQSSISASLSTNNSENYAEYSCNGCHELAGLATVHGQENCGCHGGVIGQAAGEDVLPYFYTEGRSGLINTCRANAANGGEDLDGDGEGLDNDGDGLYDAADSDCDGIVPNDDQSWSVMKALFGDE